VKSNKKGIFGGTFDPFHNGHLQVAHAAMAECALDHIEFIPAAFPPHKKGETGASYSHRLNMTRLACEGRKGFSCNDVEGSLRGPSYSIDTLDSLEKTLSTDWQLFFIIGADAFLEIELWKSYREVLRRINFIISPRQGYGEENISSLLSSLGYRLRNSRWQLENGKKTVQLMHTIPPGVSSTMLRERIEKGENIDNLVPHAIAEYIHRHKLYLSS
jgi:nicotinate-nucleotide adenylyltransferase